MEAIVKWTGGMQFAGHADSGHAVLMDTESIHGGKDTAPTPFELLVIALGGCTGMDIVSILGKMRAPLAGLEIRVHAVRATEHPQHLVSADLEYILTGRGLDDAAVKRAIELSQGKYCSIAKTVQPTAKVTYRYSIAEA